MELNRLVTRTSLFSLDRNAFVFRFFQQEERKLRQIRLQSFRQSIERLKEQNKLSKNRNVFMTKIFNFLFLLFVEKETNLKIQQIQEKRQTRLQMIQKKIHEINAFLKFSNDELRKKNESRIEHEHKLLNIRRQRLNEVYKYVFPIEHISLIEE